MADINLSKAVRSNLSSLQNTASMMSKTSDRLSTGNKVNSALDNPTNFFTASSLNSRAGDLNNLMDSMANGIKTIEAADNGLSAITKNLESMQSTLRQARQDKSFQTASYAIDAGTVGNLSFAGGAVGDNPVAVETQKSTFSGNNGFNGANGTSQDAGTLSFIGGANVNGGSAVTVDYVQGDTADSVAAKINDKLGKVLGGSAVSASVKNGQLQLTNINKETIGTVTGGQAIGLLSSAGTVTTATAATRVATAVTATTTAGTVTIEGKTVNLVGQTAADATASGTAVAAQLNAGFAEQGLGSYTAASAAGVITITRADGKNFSVAGTGGAPTFASGVSTNGKGALLAVAGSTSANVAKSTDELVSSINTNTGLTDKIRASNDNGKLRVENLSTQALSLTGASGGNVNGLATAKSTVAGNSVRADLADQFNELRDQLDKLSDDASFNGINLLRGDKLKITFNETGTSSIDIQTKGEKSVNATNLKLSTTLTAKDLDSDTGIDAFLDQTKSALNSVRAQSSAFGSNLSIVQNRQDFTKSMINTLETGAGNLTLADMNSEAANMMALQTRQSLAQSTLSMANQADQGVLQLLR